jgi:hypothetical protein
MKTLTAVISSLGVVAATALAGNSNAWAGDNPSTTKLDAVEASH